MRTSLYTKLGLAATLALLLTPHGATAREMAASARARLLTLDYARAEVGDIIRALATQSGVNVAVSPNVKGPIDVHLRGKTVDEAMQTVAALAGVAAKKLDDTYVVAPNAEMRPMLERLGTTRQVPLKFLAAKDTAEMVQGAFPDLTARPTGKSVTLIGAPEDIEAAQKVIAQSDVYAPENERVVEKVSVTHRPAAKAAETIAKAFPGVNAESAGDTVVLTGSKGQVTAARQSLELLETGTPDTEMRVYSVKYVSAGQLIQTLTGAVPEVQATPGPDSYTPQASKLNILTGAFVGLQNQQTNDQQNNQQPPVTQGANGQLTVNANCKALTIVLKGAPSALDRAMKVLEMVDTPPRQMMIEAKVVETSPDLIEERGLKWNWTRFGAYETPAGTEVQTEKSGGPGGELTDFITRPLGFGAFSRVPWTFQAILSAMVTKREAKVLANPQIAVLNDQDASIFIGDTLRFQALATSNATTGTQYTVVEVPVGIILMVHPRFNADGNITLRVHPVVSSVSNIVGGLPQTSAREAETSVRVKDGDTLVIGGLIRDSDLREMQKIPILGDLPIIGQLFRNTTRDHRRTEVMVVLTIHLIK